MYTNHFFTLNDEIVDRLSEMKPNFGYNGFGEVIFQRTYSRVKQNGGQENWNDVVIRVTNGVYSIRKDWYEKNRVAWNEEFWQDHARRFAISLFKMYWMPPGRGLWAMGTPFIYERGSMALYNCAFTNITSKEFAEDIEWLMDSLMLGVGVGFEPVREPLNCHTPQGTYTFIIEDTREAWAHSVRLLIEAYTLQGGKLPQFDYSRIRPEGLPIRGFGGLSSGPDPLKRLHGQIKHFFNRYVNEIGYDVVRLKADVANAVGVCVVAGNVRRSAEIAMGSITDQTFLELKNYELNPDRKAIGWMSNNTVKCNSDADFQLLGEVAKRVVVRGEPGLANTRNFSIGRVGKRKRFPAGRPDKAVGLNPCGEITLEHRETCNVVETCPTRCPTVDDWYEACSFAAFYASTVSLMPTHQPSTNAVVATNRRIGVSIIDGAYWMQTEGLHKVTKYLRNGYKIITTTNRWANGEAGVPEAIKKTTIKPGGTVPKLTGGVGGIGCPTFNYTLRRVRVAINNPIVPILKGSKVPFEVDVFDPKTLIFEFPTLQKGRPAAQVSLWEQAFNLVTFQREWSDNAVSNTLYFKPKWTLKQAICSWQGHDLSNAKRNGKTIAKFLCHAALKDHKNIETRVTNGELHIECKDKKAVIVLGDSGEPEQINFYEFNPNHEEDVIGLVMSHIAPLIKSCSLLPHADVGVYPQMPEEGLSEEEYNKRVGSLKKFDWTEFRGSDGIDEKYCQGDACELPRRSVR